MKIDGSIGFDLHNVGANAREAEAAGYAGVWTAETSHDPFLRRRWGKRWGARSAVPDLPVGSR